jgi:hypothetical protein
MSNEVVKNRLKCRANPAIIIASPNHEMTEFLYLSLIPEALIISHLPPDRFGAYMATGSKRQIEGPAVFIEVDQNADLSAFRMADARERCRPHADGTPRKSTYISVYNVLPRVPLNALQRAYLTTPSGLTLGVDPAPWEDKSDDQYFLYQELGPVYPRVVSNRSPAKFCDLVTDPDQLVSLPRLAFLDLRLGPLAKDPEAGDAGRISYQHLEHIRECLRSLHPDSGRSTKIVHRGMRPDILFSLVRCGLFVGDKSAGLKFFPLPGEEILERDRNLWWHSAQSLRGL